MSFYKSFDALIVEILPNVHFYGWTNMFYECDTYFLFNELFVLIPTFIFIIDTLNSKNH